MAIDSRRLAQGRGQKMKILIADDHELFLKGLELIILDWDSKAEIVKAKDYKELFSIIAKDKSFHLVLTDLAMPGAQWLEALQSIHNQLPETPIIILSAVFDKGIVQKTIEIGAAGYIPKTSSNAVIISAINLVLSGGVYIPKELLQDSLQNGFNMLKDIEMVPDNSNALEPAKILTPRQIEVIRLIAKGKSNKQIAFELGLSEGTVKIHITAILKLLNVYNRTGAVAAATHLGLLKEND